MSTTSENNKRIAKNTMLLYIRMLFTMAVTLYTSRVVLNTLGVEDFGIYNVVGGVVVMLSFFNSSLATATERFLNYELGAGTPDSLNKVFSIALTGHYIIAILIILLSETIGIWFINTKLIIPPDRMNAAFWVFQFSVLTFAVTVISVPYNASIIAHERMNIFAYVSIIEVSLKLLIVFLLVYLPFDKLILYAFLLLIISLIIRSIYTIYCKRHFVECKYKMTWDKKKFIEIFSFSGWMIIGTTTNMLSGQGVNMLINIFFGPALNAARGIAFQVLNAVNAFVANFMIAVQPQIVMSYSRKDFDNMYQLVFKSSKYSFFLLLFLSLPILLQTDYLLRLWLKDVPPYSVVFTQLVVLDLLITSSFSPIAFVSKASGKIRNYQSIIAVGFLLVFLLTWLFFKLGYPPYTTFVISILISLIGLFARLFELYYSVSFPIKNYLKEVSLKQFIVGITSSVIPLLYNHYTSSSFLQFIGNILISFVSISFFIWHFGLNSEERIFIKNGIINKINNYYKRPL